MSVPHPAGHPPPDRHRPLAGRVAVVTGAAGGLGAAIAARLVDDGARVAGLDVQAVAERTGEDGALLAGWRCDVTDAAATRQVAEEVAGQWGGIDVLVNNAGLLSGRSSSLEVQTDELVRYFTVNAVSVLLMVQACVPHLRDSPHRGRVINVGSRTFFTGAPGQLAYVASKGAVTGMTRVLARELGAHHITVNVVAPAQVSTPGTREHSGAEVFEATMRQQAIAERVTPEHFAGLVAFLASDDAVMITGQTLICDGGGLLR